MKRIFYFLYAAVFMLCRLFPVRKNRIALVSPHNANFKDGLLAVRKEFEKRGSYEVCEISSKEMYSVRGAVRFFTLKAYRLATAKYVFLNDNFMPLAHVRFSEKTKVVQLWHGEGAFKKFGLDTHLAPETEKNARACASRYDYIVVSSANMVPIYAQAFGVNQEKVLPLGNPDADYFFGEVQHDFFERYPALQDRKLILYAPTFRDDLQENGRILKAFDIEKFNEALGEKYTLLVRFHPQVHEQVQIPKSAVDVTDYEDVNELIAAADILITDYSSICMEFALLNKPMLFFAYDLPRYKRDRDFYFEYESYVPGKIARTIDEVIGAIQKNDFEQEKIKTFRAFNFDFEDNQSAKRLVDFIMKQ